MNTKSQYISIFMLIAVLSIGFTSCGGDDDGQNLVSSLKAEQLIGLWEPYHLKAWGTAYGKSFSAEADVGPNGIDYTEVHRFEFGLNGSFQSYSYENYNYSGEWKWIPNGHKGSYVIEGYHVFIYKNSLSGSPSDDYIVNKISPEELVLTEHKENVENDNEYNDQYFMKRVN